MLLIQIEGTPTAAAAPASTPKTRRRVMGTGVTTGGRDRKACDVIWRCGLNFEPAAKGSPRAGRPDLRKRNHLKALHAHRGVLCASFSLTFAPSGRLTRRLSRKDVLFDPLPGP